jgi:2-polyprenyl-6-methoxyphenol hydroxylase-like FAD-dependent oxidoreductase
MLLKEEMRRGRQYLHWKADWWQSRAEGWDGLDPFTAEGIRAYALRQKAIQQALLTKFTQLWDAPLAQDDGTEEVGQGEDTHENPAWDTAASRLVVPSDDED